MTLKEMNQPILVEKSVADSRSLIMPHQQNAVDAMTAYFELEKDMPDRSGLLVMPTGSGKTYTAVTWLLSQGVAKGYRVVWLVHRQELVEQTFQEFRKQAPLLKGTGVTRLKVLAVSGTHMKMSSACRADVYVCSIASVSNKYGYRFIERMLGATGKRRVIVVVDEAHHAVAPYYQKVLRRISALNENRVLLGLTATPSRMQEAEQRRLQEMFHIDRNLLEGRGINGYVYEVTLKQLLLAGYLANPIYEQVETHIVGEIEYACTPEDEAFFQRFQELSEKLKAQIARSSARNRIIVQKYLDNQERYGKTVIFAVNQLHAETLCSELQAAGVSCDYAVSGRGDAQAVIRAFKDNAFQVLVNVQMLTEGSDVPDVHTVFLTRQTNSDSLLMQMIGRGLRGVAAGGTKDAYIVSFHDTWNTFAHWLDPGSLDIFEPDGDAIIEPEAPEEEAPVEIGPDEEMLALLRELHNHRPEKLIPQEDGRSARELYRKLYRAMRASLDAEGEPPVFPCGWYAADGRQILVFDGQLPCYLDMARNLGRVRGRMDVDGLLRCYFDDCDTPPDEEELGVILAHMEATGELPPYFPFELRDALDPAAIAEKVNRLFEKEEEKEAWLQELYNSSAVLEQIYHTFYAFKKTVFDATVEKREAELEAVDDRDAFEIIENYYDLQELLDEVCEMFPLLRTDGLVKLAWSRRPMKSWFAICRRYDREDGGLEYAIFVNVLLSSPAVDREIIKYLIYHELLHENGYWNHDEEFRKREWQYPNSAELDGKLDSLAFAYNMDDVFSHRLSGGAGPAREPEAAPVQETPPRPKGIQEGFKYCRSCGNKLPQTAKFCDRCGENVAY